MLLVCPGKEREKIAAPKRRPSGARRQTLPGPISRRQMRVAPAGKLRRNPTTGRYRGRKRSPADRFSAIFQTVSQMPGKQAVASFPAINFGNN
jgi:hypothetical protein